MTFALPCLLLSAGLLPAAPRAALLQQAPESATVARAAAPHEYGRGLAEYLVSLAAFTAVNAAGSALLSQTHVTISQGHATFDGSTGAAVGAGACFVLSPLVAALGSWLVGKGSDAWDPSLGYATLGAYGTSLLAVAGGFGLAVANVDHDTAVAANAALYLAVPLGAVLLQNATRSERERSASLP